MNTRLPTNATLPANACALPEPWVRKIFRELSGLYGSKFADMWSGVDPQDQIEIWAEKMAGFRDQPDAIAGALKACLDQPFPPTLPEFLALCRASANASRRPAESLMLDAPKADQERVQQITAQAAETFRKPDTTDYHACWKWARKKWLAGDFLYPIQIANASSVLGEVWEMVDGRRTCRPVEVAA